MFAISKIVLLAIFTLNISVEANVFPGQCTYVPPSPHFNRAQVVGQWKVLLTSDPNLKSNTKCAHSQIGEYEDGLLIQFSNHFKNGTYDDINITVVAKHDSAPGFYQIAPLKPGEELNVTMLSFFVEENYFLVWVCTNLSQEEHLELVYVDGPADVPESIVEKFVHHLSLHGSSVSGNMIVPLPETVCEH